MRGKHTLIEIDKLNQRITPACAGKTELLDMKTEQVEDHPRVCGENNL